MQFTKDSLLLLLCEHSKQILCQLVLLFINHNVTQLTLTTLNQSKINELYL